MTSIERDALCGIKENEGRRKYRENNNLLNPKGYDYEFTDQKINHDIEYPDIDRVDEIKNRNIPAGKYLEEGYFIEKIKWDDMIDHKQAYYVCFFQNDTTIAWELHNLNHIPVFTETAATKYNVDHYEKAGTLKMASNLDIDDAALISRQGKKIASPEGIKEFKTTLKKEYEDWQKEEDRKKEEENKMMIQLTRELWKTMEN